MVKLRVHLKMVNLKALRLIRLALENYLTKVTSRTVGTKVLGLVIGTTDSCFIKVTSGTV